MVSSRKRPFVSKPLGLALKRRALEFLGLVLLVLGVALLVALGSYDASDPSLNVVSDKAVSNVLGAPGAMFADLVLHAFGLGALLLGFPVVWGCRLLVLHSVPAPGLRLLLVPVPLLLLAPALALVMPLESAPLSNPGGFWGHILIGQLSNFMALEMVKLVVVGLSLMGVVLAGFILTVRWRHVWFVLRWTGLMLRWAVLQVRRRGSSQAAPARKAVKRAPPRKAAPAAPKPRPSPLSPQDGFALPALDMLRDHSSKSSALPSTAALEENARKLEGVLEDYGIQGSILGIKPGPVVTLYELEPAPGIKTSRVIGLADDIARSMSTISVRIATVPGRNAIGIELPNATREMVSLHALLGSEAYQSSTARLPIVLGKDIAGAIEIVDLATMPHLLVAGTTGSGKSVGLNTMILSLLYRFSPEQCRLIMVDPKMLELSVYDNIPHLLTPVVTDARKAVVALKWAVREMEGRYRSMQKLGVRNIEGYNVRVEEALKSGEKLSRRAQTGFDAETGQPVFEVEEFQPHFMPFLVVIVDELADLMLVAGKEIEASIQRLAQMARAAGIHLIMATQRPSVDVITGTIKANFPTRISFMVTSKIDSRTILGEQGAEQLLGKGDMLYMSGGGRLVRLHGPFVDDGEVEAVCNYLRLQGYPDYIDSVTVDEDGEDKPLPEGDGEDMYEQAIALVVREGRASTSFLQRHFQIGYNRAARLIERMEKDGIVSAASPVGKREILVDRQPS